MQRTTVWLVRHALPDGNNGRCYGRLDLRLSPDGILQAKNIANQLARESISCVYSSCLSRAVETARILAEPHSLSVQTIDDFAEIDFGDLEGLTYEEIERRYPDIFQSWMKHPTKTHFPNGESFHQMRTRALAALGDVLRRHRNQTIAIVSHAGVIRTVLGRALAIPDDHIFRLGQRYGAINKIDYFDDDPVVELMNCSVNSGTVA
jgi:alpha-ribazole phosphatase